MIFESDLMWVIENGDSLIESDVVLGQIAGGFPFIPLELHKSTLSGGY